MTPPKPDAMSEPDDKFTYKEGDLEIEPPTKTPRPEVSPNPHQPKPPRGT
jgi:hypothetical protein